MSLAATLRNAFFGPHRGLPLAALRDAGFAEAELDAVQGTPAMADQLKTTLAALSGSSSPKARW